MTVRYAGGNLHGFPVPEDMHMHDHLLIEHADGCTEVYRRCLWFEFEDVGRGEIVFCDVELDEDQMKAAIRQVLRPC